MKYVCWFFGGLAILFGCVALVFGIVGAMSGGLAGALALPLIPYGIGGALIGVVVYGCGNLADRVELIDLRTKKMEQTLNQINTTIQAASADSTPSQEEEKAEEPLINMY